MSAEIVREPRWPAVVAMLAAGCVYWALPEPLSVGPSWMLLAIILVLTVPLVISSHKGHFNVARILTFTVNGAITIAMIAQETATPHHHTPICAEISFGSAIPSTVSQNFLYASQIRSQSRALNL